MKELPDLQSERPIYSFVSLASAGVYSVRIPVWILDKSEHRQRIIANLKIGTHLDKGQRGVHMSRFLEQLETTYEADVSLDYLKDNLLPKIVKTQNSESGEIEMEFDYFIPVEAPVSKVKSKLPVECKFQVSTGYPSRLVVRTPVMLVCPCSLEMSERYQAHNQRGHIEIDAQVVKFIWIENLAKIAIDAASCAVYPILKREDEKWVTDESHKHPKFVEDACREVYEEVSKMDSVRQFWVTVDSQESIHAHNAFARTSGMGTVSEY